MQDWRDLCKTFDVEESDVPHRGTQINSELKHTGTCTTFKSEESSRPYCAKKTKSGGEKGEKCNASKLKECGGTLSVKPFDSKEFDPEEIIDLCFDD